MRATILAVLAVSGVTLGTPAHADWVPPFKGNDTGGIISYSLFQQGVDVKALAVNHCAGYGKGVRLLGAQANEGGYISFECVWVNPGYSTAPVRAAY
ncbi:MAG: hypothetical protein J0I29_01265 [Rhizobiales bacterium]|nr:hypothetical protein [Hyphomicrobiales bacterium]